MFNENLKIAIMGRAGTGKTAILNRYVYQMFVDRYMVTAGNMVSKLIEYDDHPIRLDIMDTPGGYCFEYGRRQAILTADAFVLVYSVGEILSFERLCEMKEQIEEKRSENVPVVIVQTMTDLEGDQWFPSCSELHQLIPTVWKNPHFQVSAKMGFDMSPIFKRAIEEYYKRSCRSG